jgi:hypothetical protein
MELTIMTKKKSLKAHERNMTVSVLSFLHRPIFRLSVIPASPVTTDGGLVGVWHLSIRCDTCDYRLGVAARAHLHFNVENEKPGQ